MMTRTERDTKQVRQWRAAAQIILAICALLPASVAAQHPIDIQRKAAGGDYYGALADFDKMPERRVTVEARLAAARSAWGLGLPSRAISEFDSVLREENIDAQERAKAYLSHGIIEYQEGRYQVSNLYVEKVIDILRDAGPLRAKAWLLWGENLYQLQAFGAAEQKYMHALEESPAEEQPEVYYRLGLCRMKLGKPDEAQKSFQNVPVRHERSASSIRSLAELALEEKDFETAQHWLSLGRKEFPDQFLDSWVDYALVQVAVAAKDGKRVRSIRAEASNKYPPSDPWLTLLDSAAEAYEWK